MPNHALPIASGECNPSSRGIPPATDPKALATVSDAQGRTEPSDFDIVERQRVADEYFSNH